MKFLTDEKEAREISQELMDAHRHCGDNAGCAIKDGGRLISHLLDENAKLKKEIACLKKIESLAQKVVDNDMDLNVACTRGKGRDKCAACKLMDSIADLEYQLKEP